MGWSIGELKERIIGMEMKGGQWLGIELKAEESRSLCDAFLLLRLRRMFFLFLFGMWNMWRRKRRRCGDRWKDQDLAMFFF